MTSNLKCPFCQQELCQDYTGVMYCCNEDCKQSADWYGSMILWQELAQAKQDLEIARNALKDIVFCKQFDSVIAVRKYADKALEQIEYKE